MLCVAPVLSMTWFLLKHLVMLQLSSHADYCHALASPVLQFASSGNKYGAPCTHIIEPRADMQLSTRNIVQVAVLVIVLNCQ